MSHLVPELVAHVRGAPAEDYLYRRTKSLKRGNITIKKLMLLAAAMAMLVVSAVPALAQRGDRDRDHRHFFDHDGGVIAQEAE
jgi:hypothetical protein